MLAIGGEFATLLELTDVELVTKQHPQAQVFSDISEPLVGELLFALRFVFYNFKHTTDAKC